MQGLDSWMDHYEMQDEMQDEMQETPSCVEKQLKVPKAAHLLVSIRHTRYLAAYQSIRVAE